MVCGFHADVKETEWLSAQMRSQTSVLKVRVCVWKSNRVLGTFTLLTYCIKGQRTKLSELSTRFISWFLTFLVRLFYAVFFDLDESKYG